MERKMLNHKKEGMPLHGENFAKYHRILTRIKKHGCEAMQKEIDKHWTEIMLRTEALSEFRQLKNRENENGTSI
jgi:hypothetical protein